jgi:hypothetical protein
VVLGTSTSANTGGLASTIVTSMIGKPVAVAPYTTVERQLMAG